MRVREEITELQGEKPIVAVIGKTQQEF